MNIEIKNRFTGEILIRGECESIKDCLEKNKGADLRGADLSSADLRGAYLRYADLRYADLRDADLRDADLSSAYLSSADLRGAYLRDADLRDADLRDADLSSAYLRGADLRDADLRDADLRDADLRDADLRDAYFYGEKLEKEPMQIIGIGYFVLITKEHIKIGCECHKVEEWKEFDDKRILEMDGKTALKWWRDNKEFVLNCHEKHLNL
jgi:uncharacterized protein YjbI with pentapeptide repeats